MILSKIDDLRVNPFVDRKKELFIMARFPCPICSEPIEMKFSGADIKQLHEGYLRALRDGQK